MAQEPSVFHQLVSSLNLSSENHKAKGFLNWPGYRHGLSSSGMSNGAKSRVKKFRRNLVRCRQPELSKSHIPEFPGQKCKKILAAQRLLELLKQIQIADEWKSSEAEQKAVKTNVKFL